MSGRIWTSEEKLNIMMESFQNPNIAIAERCRNHGIAVSLFYKRKELSMLHWRQRFLLYFIGSLALKKNL
ncbi:hypothetical protein SE19_02410 [Acidiplasma aeolicum]|uniref:Transposase n=1 Tax=Acidiplasma aeolicum TaxID=507754 RepID=A0A0P9CMT7_9ARCH|nr:MULTISPECIES: hypothetical protein [Acidiplasma]KPV47123.1 hypothetical protein SE19_02410 [Acidiplasma aeolicum]